MSKPDLRSKALELRREGWSYSEILKRVQVAKSTLSLWFKNVGLSKPQKQRLTQKRLEAAYRGALKRKSDRLALIEKIKQKAIREVGIVNRKLVWLIGAALYWAEGNKQKEHNVSQGVSFSNSDPLMVRFFCKWLTRMCKVNRDEMQFELYIHESDNVERALRYWSQILNINEEALIVRYKKHNPKTKRRNTGENYYGLVRIRVCKSVNLNRRIMGWIHAVCKQFC